MIPVATIVTLIETISALTELGISTVQAIEKLKNGDPSKVDLTELKMQLMRLPDLSDLYPKIPEDKEGKGPII